MADRPRSPTLGLRPAKEVLDRLDAVAEAVTAKTGTTARRGGVAMDALLVGLEVLEERNGIKDGGKE